MEGPPRRIVDVELGLLLLALLVASVALFQVRSARPQLASILTSLPMLPGPEGALAPGIAVTALPFAQPSPERSPAGSDLPGSQPLGAPAAQATPPDRPAKPRPLQSLRTPAIPPLTRPADWIAKDAEVARIVVLSRRPPTAQSGEEPCACGGVWRYTLGGSDDFPIWRCLHCGELHSGAEAIPWD